MFFFGKFQSFEWERGGGWLKAMKLSINFSEEYYILSSVPIGTELFQILKFMGKKRMGEKKKKIALLLILI